MAQKPEKKILIISYHFPPSLAVGGFRSAGFARHLPSNGWKPYVLTLREEEADNVDTQGRRIPGGTDVFRAGTLPTILDLYKEAKRIYQSLRSGKRVSLEDLKDDHVRSHPGTPESGGHVEAIKRLVISVFVTLPDEERKWVLPALNKGLGIIRRERIDCILTTSPPHSVQLVGLVLKKLSGKMWVADFRDPWMTPFSKGLYRTTAISNRIERRLEKAVMANADLVLATTGILAETLRDHYRTLPEDRFAYLPNGFDPEAFSSLKSIEKERRFTITYTGSLYLGRSPEPVFRALAELGREGVDLAGIRLRLVGNCRHMDGRPTDEIVRKYGLDRVVEVEDYVPHEKAMEIIKASHLALLLAPNQPFQIPAKVYDYLGAGTRILALAGKGATAEMIHETGFGKVFEPEDVSGIRNFIRESLAGGAALRGANAEQLSAYHRKTIASNLAVLLER